MKYLFTIILSIFLWEILPFRKNFYILKANVAALITSLKINAFIVVKKHIRSIGFLTDFFIFYVVFKWRNGIVLTFIKQIIFKIKFGIMDIIEMLYNILVYISPIEVLAWKYSKLRIPFIISTIICIIYFLFLIYVSCINKNHFFIKIIVSFVIFIFVWNIMYKICCYISKFDFFNIVVFVLISIICNVLIAFLFFFPFAFILEELEN